MLVFPAQPAGLGDSDSQAREPWLGVIPSPAAGCSAAVPVSLPRPDATSALLPPGASLATLRRLGITPLSPDPDPPRKTPVSR